MKNKFNFLTLVLTIALALPMYAQYTPTTDTVTRPDAKQHDMLNLMGKPTFEATSGEFHFSIWVTPQQEHTEMMEDANMGMDKKMKGMKEKGMDMDTNMKDKGMNMETNMKEKGMNMDTNMKEKGMDMDFKMKEKGMDMDTNMKAKGMVMDNETKEAMMTGTHHIMIEVKSTKSGKEVKNASSARVSIVSPTNKNSSVDLKMPMPNHFGSGITLDEKGEYQLTVSVTVGDIAKTMKLKYTVN